MYKPKFAPDETVWVIPLERRATIRGHASVIGVYHAYDVEFPDGTLDRFREDDLSRDIPLVVVERAVREVFDEKQGSKPVLDYPFAVGQTVTWKPHSVFRCDEVRTCGKTHAPKTGVIREIRGDEALLGIGDMEGWTRLSNLMSLPAPFAEKQPAFKEGDKVIVTACSLHGDGCYVVGAPGVISERQEPHWKVALTGGGYAMCTDEQMRPLPECGETPTMIRETAVMVTAMTKTGDPRWVHIITMNSHGSAFTFESTVWEAEHISIGDTYTVTITKQ